MRKKLSPDKWSSGFEEVAERYAPDRKAALDLKERRAIEHIANEYAEQDAEAQGARGPDGELLDTNNNAAKPFAAIEFADYSQVRHVGAYNTPCIKRRSPMVVRYDAVRGASWTSSQTCGTRLYFLRRPASSRRMVIRCGAMTSSAISN